MRSRELHLNGHVFLNSTRVNRHSAVTLIPHSRCSRHVPPSKHDICWQHLQTPYCYPRGAPNWRSWWYKWSAMPPWNTRELKKKRTDSTSNPRAVSRNQRGWYNDMHCTAMHIEGSSKDIYVRPCRAKNT